MMQMQYAAKDLFQLQTELVNAKVENGVNNAIDKFIQHIDALRTEIHDLRKEMNDRFNVVDNRLNVLENRMTAVETKLGLRNELQSELKNRTIEYAFKTGWLILATVVSAVFLYFHIHIA